jgi:hypothetical protein
MNKDCKILKEVSINVRQWIEKQPNVKEESLTDWLLYSISDKTNRIKYYSFTRNEEAKTTGADWEWWFLFPKFAYRFRVQAKKLNVNGDNYPSICYVNKYGLQIEKLIEDSDKQNSLPVYAFYTCRIEKVGCTKKILDEGIYIANAKELNKDIVKRRQRKILYNDILKNSIPLSCILCCPLIHQEGFDKFILKYLASEQSEESNSVIGQYELQDLPNYVNDLLKYKELDWFEKEYSRNIEEINSILLFDYREECNETLMKEG